MAQQFHVIESGETPKQVADMFGVSVQELLSSNSAVLNGRWTAGVEVRDPSHKDKQIKEAIRLGATAEQIALALNISVDDAVTRFGVLRRDELEAKPKQTKKLTEALDDIDAPRNDMRRSDGSIKSSKGFLGPIKNVAGETMTEFTTDLGEEYGGYPANYNIPTLVPGLTAPELALLKQSKSGKPVDTSKPLGKNIVNKARQHAKTRIDQGLNPLYQDFEEYSDVSSAMDQRLAEVIVDARPKSTFLMPTLSDMKEPTRTRPASEIYAGSAITQGVQALQEMIQPAPDDGLRYVSAPARKLVDESYKPESDYDKWLQGYYKDYKTKRTQELTGQIRSVAGGLTFQLADEMEALIRASAKEEGSYEEELAIIRQEQDRYEMLNPGKAMALEAAGAIPTGTAFAKGLTRLGIKSVAPQAGIEGLAYGAGSGDTFEQRVQLATLGGISGMALGKVIDMAITPSSSGGLRTKADDVADESLPIEDQPASLDIERRSTMRFFKK